MIINKDFYYIDNDKLELRTVSAYQLLSNFDDHDYVYVEFKWSLAKLVECLTQDDYLNRLIHGDLYLILCNSHEAFHDLVHEIYVRVVKELQIPEHKILLLSESADILDEVKRVSSSLGKQEIKVKWARIFEWSACQHTVHYQKGIQNAKLIEKPFSKAYLNFNRRWRLHRPALVALLKANNLLDRGYVSLAPVEGHTWENIWWQLLHYHNDEIKTTLEQHKEEICSLPPLFLDTTELYNNQAAWDDTTEYLYNDSYFSIVAETNYYDDKPGRFLSEKVFKPVIMKHPFILVANAYSLKLFKELGYKTFSPFIDESYDNIEDNSKRLLAIINEVKRLSYLNTPQLSDYLQGLNEICEYNYQFLMSKNIFITDLN